MMVLPGCRWGQAAWHGDEIRVERSLVSAGDDPAFLEVAARALGDMGIVLEDTPQGTRWKRR